MSGSTLQSSRMFGRISADEGGERPDAGPEVSLSFDGAAELLRAWREGLTPDPDLTVSAWADAHRVLSPRGSSEAGRWRTSRTPYLRAIMDALSPRLPYQ